MRSLAKVQRLFASAIDGADSAGTAQLHALIAAGKGLSPGHRLEVYRDSSWRAREKALEAIYPVSRQVLGDRCFAGLTARYVAAYPSETGDLNVYGADFSEYLAAEVQAHEGLAELPYLADLARLEWQWHEVYYAPNDTDFDMLGFSALAAEGQAEQARFQLSTALRLLSSDYPVHEIWQRHREGSNTSAVAVSQGDRLVIRRAGFRPSVEAVEPEMFRLLSGLSHGRTLDVLAADGLAVEQIPGLIAAGWIVSFTAAGEA